MNHSYRYYALFLCLSLFFMFPPSGWCQTTGNYVISRSYKLANVSEDPKAANLPATSTQAVTQITYYDGLGKPRQLVSAFQAASKGDVIQLTQYDNLHRPIQTFLPTSFPNNGGGSKVATDIITQAKAYYASDLKVAAKIVSTADEAFSTQTQYELSPLSRVKQQVAPGAAAVGKQEHGVNILGDVRFYRTTGTGLTNIAQASAPDDTYKAGELTFTKTTDEDEGTITEFVDRNNRTVLKRVFTGDGNLNTYYVYDEKGQLRAVLQPKYEEMGGNSLDKNAFLYRYDEHGRLVEKKIPGNLAMQLNYKGTTDLIETFNDGRGQKFYYLYDDLNRQIEFGQCMDGSCNTKEGILKTYYDTYGFGPFQNYTAEPGLTGLQFDDNPQVNRIGLVTGHSARVLKPNGVYDNTWLQTVIYYDNKYRVLQTVRQLYGLLSGAFERVSYQVAFDGKVEQEWTSQLSGSQSYKLTKQFSYDHANRLIKTRHWFYENGAIKRSYTHNQQLYNELGQPSAKSLQGVMTVLRSKYTPRGWLGTYKADTPTSFSLGLAYNDKGNITTQSWATKSYPNRGMSMTYDKSSRLTNAIGTLGFVGNDESQIQYDPNGNIFKLERRFNSELIDKLTYNNDGNQLKSVLDEALGEADRNSNASQLVKGFIDGATSTSEMAYDENGNLTRDDNRGITSVVSNALNLPRMVVRNGVTVYYTYDGAGTKLQSEAAAPTNLSTFYAGSFEYESGSVSRVGLEEGQLRRSGSDYSVQYYLRDHLGNVRSVLDTSGVVLQETEYFAFGQPIQWNGVDKNSYLYNGKEKQVITDWLDYGARMFDPTIGRWNSIDHMSEKFYSSSPYNYTDNNPILRTDPDGRDWTIGVSQDKNGNTIYNVTIKGVVYNNSSNRNINLSDLTDAITKQIQNAFNFQGQGYSVVTTVNLRSVESADDIAKTDHVFQVVDQKYLGGAVANAELNGLKTNIGSERINEIISGFNTRTIPHELGHTAGWNHPHGDGDKITDAQPRTAFEEMTRDELKSNLMSQTVVVQQMNANYAMNHSTNITRRQMELLFYNQGNGNLNRNSPVTTGYGLGLMRVSNLLPPILVPKVFNSVRR